MTLSDCHPEFQERIAKLAGFCGKSTEDIYALWRRYQAACVDQSCLLWEFVSWYAADLGADVEGMRSAVR